MIKTTLYRQLISLAVIICGIIFISLGLLLPKLLLPIYEKNIYQYLKQPLEFIYKFGLTPPKTFTPYL